jgi:hypothetical protein
MKFVYLKSIHTYVNVADVSRVIAVLDGGVTTAYDLIVGGFTIRADATVDGATIHNDILGIPQDIAHP